MEDIEYLYKVYLNTYITLVAEDRQIIARQQSLKGTFAMAIAAEGYLQGEGLVSLRGFGSAMKELDNQVEDL